MAKLSDADRQITDDIITSIEIEKRSLTQNRKLCTFNLDTPELTQEYRVGELRKLQNGIPSDWGETELAAEKLMRAHEEGDE